MFTDATGLSTSRFLPLGGKAGGKPAGVPASPLDGASLPGAPMRAGRDAEIIAQGARAEYCYRIVAGCVRTVKLLEDGRRQVGAFLFAGDLFGWDAGGEHAFAAEAVTDVTLRRFKISDVEERAATDHTFATRLRRYLIAQIGVARNHLVLLGRKTAAERIASFLTEMTDRLDSRPGSGIDLPMSRADIADYLGLTVETVCRGLTELRRHGTVTVDRTRIVIRDRAALGQSTGVRLH